MYVLCYSLIMLNVDAHSPRIPEAAKMTSDQFVSNNRGINKLICQNYILQQKYCDKY